MWRLAVARGRVGLGRTYVSSSPFREKTVSIELVSDEKVDEVLRLLDDPNFIASAPTMMTAWGRRPPM